jgi:diazepam-binding inhibitor (GABA receptor modulating acyl-CoA-binding protein)
MGADEFDYAKDRIWDLPRDISNEDKLELYKLSSPFRMFADSSYKQAVFGDCNVGRPGGIDLKGQAKWDAWASIRGM